MSKHGKRAEVKKEKAIRWLSLSLIGGCGGRGGGRTKLEGDDSYQKSEIDSVIVNTMGTNLAYGILCDPISSDDKEIYKLSGNHIFNLQNLTTEI